MGTRHITGFVIDGQVKAQYGQFDGYPDGVGTEILEWARSNVADTSLIARARAIELVNEDTPATSEQQVKYAQYADTGVSTGDPKEWYVLLRNMQGGLDGPLEAGVMLDAGDFPSDSLFCEWGWLVNLDDATLECYEGFQKEPHEQGRFATQKRDDAREYYPIKLIKTYELAHLPTQEQFLADLNKNDA